MWKAVQQPRFDQYLESTIMHLVIERQTTSLPSDLPAKITNPQSELPVDGSGDGLSYTTTITSAILSTQINSQGQPLNTWTNGLSIMTSTLSGPPPVAFATQPSSTSTSFRTTPTPSPAQTAAASQSSTASSKSLPLSTLIPAIVVPIVVVALVAPVVLYFCLTRHDRERSKSRMSNRVSSRAYTEPRAELKTPHFRQSSSETGASKASEIMNFDLRPTIEKSLPVVNVTQAPDTLYERPDTFQVHRGVDSPIGQAISRYSGSHYSSSIIVEAPKNRTSLQDLSEENMRIARLVNDSRASFGGREQDEISDISAPEERNSRHVDRRGVDELSDVSSIYDDERPVSTDHGAGILSNNEARRSGPLR